MPGARPERQGVERSPRTTEIAKTEARVPGLGRLGMSKPWLSPYPVGAWVKFQEEDMGKPAFGWIRYALIELEEVECREVSTLMYAIEVPKWEGTEGHECNGYVPNGNGWWAYHHEIMGVADNEPLVGDERWRLWEDE